MLWGKRPELFARLREAGLHPIIQTAFDERVNLTFRQSVAALSRRTWAYAQTERHLRLHCEWFRLTTISSARMDPSRTRYPF